MTRNSGNSVEPNLKQAVALVTKMMPISGPSGHEGRIGQFITKALRRAGLAQSAIKYDRVHLRSPFGGEVGNLIVKLPGRGAGMRRCPRRLLMAHIDTVPTCVGSRPKRHGSWIRSADRNTGLGADNRSGAAAVLTAALTILKNRTSHPPLTLFWPVQEEVGLIGARLVSMRDLGQPKLAFNFDSGTPLRVISGATGAYRMAIDVEGLASHAGVHPDLGISAITIAARAIAALEQDGYLGPIQKGRQQGTSNVGVIDGGQATNVVAPSVKLKAEVRADNPRFRLTILNRFKRAFEQAARQTQNVAGRCGRVHFNVRLDYQAFRLKPGEAAVAAACSAVQSVVGTPPSLESVKGGLDANWLTQRGVPTVTLGAGQHGAHTVDETLNVPEFEQGCRIAVRLATGTE